MRMAPLLLAGLALAHVPFDAGLAQAQAKGTRAETSDHLKFNKPTLLSADKQQAIQSAGRAVLGVKKGATEDVDRLALRNELKDLAQTIDDTLTVKRPHIALQRRRAGGPSSRMGNPTETDGIQTKAVELRIAGLRAQRLRLQARRPGVAERGDESRDQALAAKARGIEEEVQAAIDAPARQRFERLAQLRSRLQPKSLAEQLQSVPEDTVQRASPSAVMPDARNEEPILQTIVRHR